MEYIENSGLVDLASKLNDLQLGTYYLSVQLDAFNSSYQTKPSRGRRTSKDEPRLPASEAPYLKAGLLAADSLGITQSTEPAIKDSSTITFIPGLEISEQRVRAFSLGAQCLKRRPQRRRTSSLGDLSEPSSRALFMDMIYALNDAFPDYDFADSKIEQFQDVEVGLAVQRVNASLAELTLHQPLILEQLWSSIDELVNLRSCEVFAFIPTDSDTEEEFLWRFHFFFFNKTLRTLLYFSCGAKRLVCLYHVLYHVIP
jgi:hypothetical protein